MAHTISRWTCIALLGIIGPALSTNTADAAYKARCHRAVHCRYQAVIRYVERQVVAHRWVTRHDRYGCPHRVRETYYRTVRVPVKQYVKVCY